MLVQVAKLIAAQSFQGRSHAGTGMTLEDVGRIVFDALYAAQNKARQEIFDAGSDLEVDSPSGRRHAPAAPIPGLRPTPSPGVRRPDLRPSPTPAMRPREPTPGSVVPAVPANARPSPAAPAMRSRAQPIPGGPMPGFVVPAVPAGARRSPAAPAMRPRGPMPGIVDAAGPRPGPGARRGPSPTQRPRTHQQPTFGLTPSTMQKVKSLELPFRGFLLNFVQSVESASSTAAQAEALRKLTVFCNATTPNLQEVPGFAAVMKAIVQDHVRKDIQANTHDRYSLYLEAAERIWKKPELSRTQFENVLLKCLPAIFEEFIHLDSLLRSDNDDSFDAMVEIFKGRPSDEVFKVVEAALAVPSLQDAAARLERELSKASAPPARARSARSVPDASRLMQKLILTTDYVSAEGYLLGKLHRADFEDPAFKESLNSAIAETLQSPASYQVGPFFVRFAASFTAIMDSRRYTAEQKQVVQKIMALPAMKPFVDFQASSSPTGAAPFVAGLMRKNPLYQKIFAVAESLP